MSIRLALLLLLIAGPALAAKDDWRARVGLESGVDTNPGRHYGPSGAGFPTTSPSAMVSLVGAVEGRLGLGPVILTGGWDVGARGFLQRSEESTLVQALRADVEYELGSTLALIARGRGKDRRGAGREYTDVQGLAGVAWLPDARLTLELLAQVGGFDYREERSLNFASFGGALNAIYRFDRRHTLSLQGEASERHFGDGRARDPRFESLGGRSRHDLQMVAGVSYGFRGPFALTAGYSYIGLSSNSFGETVLRHRVSVLAGVPLPWELTLLAQLGLQLASYPDGIYLSPELILLEDDENQNSLALKLTRPLGRSLDLELRWALYQNSLSGNGLSYLRQVAGVGLSWRLQ